MAYDPCGNCEERYEGPSRLTYVTWYVEDDKHAYRWALCPKCGDELRTRVGLTGMLRGQDGRWAYKPGPLPWEGVDQPSQNGLKTAQEAPRKR